MNIFKKTFPFIFTFIAFIIFPSDSYSQHQENIFSENFIKAIASENIDNLVNLKPRPEFWRLVLKKETKGMTDEEINEKANKNEKLILDFDNIIYSAKKEKIDLTKITFKRAKVEKIWEDEKMPFSIIIKYGYMGKEGEFALSVFKFEGKYYLSEILVSFDLFNNLK